MSNQQALTAALQKSAKVIQKYKTQLATYHEPIAIVGMGCRLPNGIETPAQYWQALLAGFDAIIDLPSERAHDFPSFDQRADDTQRKLGAYLNRVDQFDPFFFGLSPREVKAMDPNHRLLLETAWEALEHANIVPASLHNSETGVFVGIGSTDYLKQSAANGRDVYTVTGNYLSGASGRIAYLLGLTGPAVSFATACSSSLVSIHYAVQSLRNGACDAALAGGVSVIVDDDFTTMMTNGNALSADSRCKTFDAAANGYVRGEGCGMLVLKRLSDAQAAGDTIIAIIRGAAVNQDGPSGGLTVPNGPSQERVIQRALKDARLKPEQISYVEAHGTGTPLGDPIEIGALSGVFGKRDRPLHVGSVKTNIGHLEWAAGVAGVMKLALSVQNGQLPPHLHFKNPNPLIDFETAKISVPTTVQAWSADERIGGVSSFGISGTNAHLIVGEAPATAEEATNETDRSHHLLTISAKSADALHDYVQKYHDFLAENPDTNLGDLAYTSHIGRTHFPHRATFTADSVHNLKTQLSTPRTTHHAPRTTKLAFLFTGQGAQYAGMGRELYETEPLFRDRMDRCDAAFQETFGASLLDYIYTENDDLLESHPVGQACNYALECSLADLWRSWGVQPDVVLGHSLGDFAAAYTAGVIGLEDGLRLVTERGRLMQTADGSMVSILATESQVAPFVERYDDVTVGVINSLMAVVLSGSHDGIAAVADELREAGFKVRKLAIPVAAHSPMLDPVLDRFEAAVRRVKLSPPKLPVVSSMTGKRVTTELTDPIYWRNQLRNTVRFADAVMTLHEMGINTLLEAGPQATLLGVARQTDEAFAFAPSLKQGENATAHILGSLGKLYELGVAVDWEAFDAPFARQKITLPIYPFQRQRYWVDLPKQRPTQVRPLIGRILRSPAFKQTIFETPFSVAELPFLSDHRVFGEVVAPGASYLAMALNALLESDHLSRKKSDQDGRVPVLRNVALPQPMVLPNDAERTVQLVLSPDGEFEVISFADPAAQAITHVVGDGDVLELPTPTAVDLADLRERFDWDVSAELANIYAHETIEFGERFRWLTGLWRERPVGVQEGRDGVGAETLAQLHLPDAIQRTSGYAVHPCLLDACFQAVGAMQSGETLLPFALAELVLHQSPHATMTWWCHTRQVGERKWDIQLFDGAGNGLLSLRGFEVRAASADSLRGADAWHDWLYEVAWQPQPLTAASIDTGKHWLILADQQGCGAALADELTRRGDVPTVVYAGESYALPHDLFGIVHLWSLDDAEAGLRSALALTQSLVGDQRQLDALYFVTQEAQASETVCGVDQATLWGLGKVIALEHPELNCRRVDISAELPINKLCEAITTRSDEDQVALRLDGRHVARLQRLTPPHSLIACNPHATYLVTGGLRGLGLATAQELVKRGARHLLLVGRRAVSAENRTTLDALTKQGVTVTIAQADITKRDELAKALAQIDDRFPLKGVVHSAGVLRDGALLNQSWDNFTTVLAPKVAGTWLLHELTADLDFFVLFSSMASMMGNAGQANHAAANAFLDAFARYRRAQGQPALSINWGAWAEIGAAAALSDAKQLRLAAAGQGMIAPELGLTALAHLLDSASVQVGVAPVDWAAYFSQTAPPPYYEALRPRMSDEAARPQTVAEQLAQLDADAQITHLKQHVRGVVAAVLGIPNTTQIDMRQDFFKLGMDSLMSLELTKQLKRNLQASLPATLAFEHSTVEQLSDYLAHDLLQLNGNSPETDDDLTPVPRNRPMPLSLPQERMWLRHHANPNYIGNSNTFFSYRLTGALDVAALQAGFDALVARHEILRTTFPAVDGMPVQVVQPPHSVNIIMLDWSRLPVGEREDGLADLAQQEVQAHRFDFERGPLVRVTLVKLEESVHQLVFSLHHIAADAWSLNLLFDELGTFYGGLASKQPVTLDPLPLQYADYAYHQRQALSPDVLEETQAYWRDWLADEPPLLSLPLDRPRPATPDFAARKLWFALSADLTNQLRLFGRRTGATLFATIQAALALWLHELSGQTAITIATPFANRTHWKTEKLIGQFSRLLVLRMDVGAHPTFEALLPHVRTVMADAIAHQLVPFAQAVRAIQPERKPHELPHRAFVSFLPSAPRQLDLHGLTATTEQTDDVMLMPDIALMIWEDGDQLKGWWEYKPSLLDEATMRTMIGAFERLLWRVSTDSALNGVNTVATVKKPT